MSLSQGSVLTGSDRERVKVTQFYYYFGGGGEQANALGLTEMLGLNSACQMPLPAEIVSQSRQGEFCFLRFLFFILYV